MRWNPWANEGAGEMVNAKPEPLIKPLEEEKAPTEGKQDGSKVTESGGASKGKVAEATSGAKPKEEEKKADKKKEEPSESMQSAGFNSSLLETSEDEEAKTKAKEKEDKKQKKGLREEELNAMIDIDLCETETLTLIYIPSTVVPHDTEDNGPYAQVNAKNEEYKQLLNNKEYRGDNYTTRGAQTYNLGQKPREVQWKGFQQEEVKLQVNYFEIVDAENQD